jgi:DNA invertase Pin-like site-specific DNA recombinase
MKAIGYTRVSTVEQADSGLGLEAQAERIKAYCTLKGLYLAEIIIDAGVSGGKPLAQREGGERLIAAMKDRRVKAVVMLKLDRGFRDAGDCLNTVDQWERAGIALHVIDLGGNAIDTTSAAGRFMLVVLAGAAEMERNLTRERTRSALAIKKANGQRVGAIPYGYDLAPAGHTLILTKAEQAIIGEIRAMRSSGMRLQSIARTLSARRVPTKKGKSMDWSHQSVSRIVTRGQ